MRVSDRSRTTQVTLTSLKPEESRLLSQAITRLERLLEASNALVAAPEARLIDANVPPLGASNHHSSDSIRCCPSTRKEGGGTPRRI